MYSTRKSGMTLPTIYKTRANPVVLDTTTPNNTMCGRPTRGLKASSTFNAKKLSSVCLSVCLSAAYDIGLGWGGSTVGAKKRKKIEDEVLWDQVLVHCMYIHNKCLPKKI